MNGSTRNLMKDLHKDGSICIKQDVAGRWKFAAIGWLGGMVTAIGVTLLWGHLDYIVSPVDRVVVQPYFSTVTGGPAVTSFRPGEAVYYNAAFDRNRACSSTFQSHWRNDNYIVIGGAHSAVLQHHQEDTVELSLEVTIPARLEPGPWEYQVVGEWKCNPITTHKKFYPAVSFEIVS